MTENMTRYSVEFGEQIPHGDGPLLVLQTVSGEFTRPVPVYSEKRGFEAWSLGSLAARKEGSR